MLTHTGITKKQLFELLLMLPEEMEWKVDSKASVYDGKPTVTVELGDRMIPISRGGFHGK